jgi:pimeloyl-ACP methyl ester carboxylesterase
VTERRIEFHRPPESPLAPYYMVRTPESRGLLVSVHGISRNAREHARAFAGLAAHYGVSLVCPLFVPDVFPDYQRLGRDGLGARADEALEIVLEDFRRRSGQDTARFDLFGFSGGAQFAHRYALAQPRRIRRLALTAPGWFTWPDVRHRFPWGVRPSPRLADLTFDVAGLLEVPMLVMVGRRDVERDEALRTGRRADAQGRNRLARARRWVRSINRCARARGLPEPARLHLLSSAGHEFSATLADGMDRVLFGFLYAPNCKEKHDETQ